MATDIPAASDARVTQLSTQMGTLLSARPTQASVDAALSQKTGGIRVNGTTFIPDSTTGVTDLGSLSSGTASVTVSTANLASQITN